MKTRLLQFLFAGWLLPVAGAVVYFGRWIREIVVPTLKGGNFEQLYDLHRVHYLDNTLLLTVLAFFWFGAAFLSWLGRNIRDGCRPLSTGAFLRPLLSFRSACLLHEGQSQRLHDISVDA